MNREILTVIVFLLIVSIPVFADNPLNLLINMQTLNLNVTNNSGFWNISVADSDKLDNYHANYFCPLNASACAGAAESDPIWTLNYTAFNTSWSTDLWNTSTQMIIAINNSGYYNITSQQCYYLNNATDRALFLNTSNDSYVPYTGATANIDLGVKNLTTTGFGQFAWQDLLESSTLPTPPANTLRLYVEDRKGFSVFKYIDDTGMLRQLVSDSILIVKNVGNATIPAMRFVYATGSDNQTSTISLAKADSLTTMPAIGVTLESIVNNSYGRVMQVGIMENINSNDFSEGDTLYVSDTSAGLARNTPPLTPNLTQEMGTVLIKNVTNGTVQIIARGLNGNEFGTINNFTVATGKYFIGDGSLLTSINTTNNSYNALLNNISNNTAYLLGKQGSYFWNTTGGIPWSNMTFPTNCSANTFVNGSAGGLWTCFAPPINTTDQMFASCDNNTFVKHSNTSYVLTNNASYILGTNTSYVLTNNITYVQNGTINNFSANQNFTTNNITFSLGGKIVLYNSTNKASCLYANDTYSFIIDTNC